jgi:hypothetical protein
MPSPDLPNPNETPAVLKASAKCPSCGHKPASSPQSSAERPGDRSRNLVSSVPLVPPSSRRGCVEAAPSQAESAPQPLMITGYLAVR